MASKFARNNMLWISATLGGLGLFATVLSWWLAYAPPPAQSSYLDWYRALLTPINAFLVGEFNLVIMIGAPILLLSFAWTFGEQLAKRRRFATLIEPEKKSDFARNRRDLEELARNLPDSYRQAIKEKEKRLAGKP